MLQRRKPIKEGSSRKVFDGTGLRAQMEKVNAHEYKAFTVEELEGFLNEIEGYPMTPDQAYVGVQHNKRQLPWEE